MRPGVVLTSTFRFEDSDTLIMVTKTDQNGPITDPTTFKLTRLE